MFKNYYPLVFLFLIITLSSCAASYKSINPERLRYHARSNDSGIVFSYKYDILKESGNKKYAKKEVRANLQLVAVRLYNGTDSSITMSENITLYSGGLPISPFNTESTIRQLNQNTALYLLYSLLWLQIGSCNNNGCKSATLPIGIPISIGNMIVSSTANSNLKNELNNYDILNDSIEPGETAYGIIGIKDTGFNPLSVKYRE